MAPERNGVSRREVIATVTITVTGLALGLGASPAVAAEGVGPSKLMIIRHAEKPAPDGMPPYGLDADGQHDPDALLVRGWQRAGALARFFAPRDGAMPAGLLRPTFLVAAAATHAHPSRRAGMTLAPLAELTGLVPDSTFGPDQETAAAASILRRSGVGLVAWEHKRIRDLVAALTGGAVQGPHWSKHRFDMVLVLDRDGASWRLNQVAQLLLGGDSAKPLRFDKTDDDDD